MTHPSRSSVDDRHAAVCFRGPTLAVIANVTITAYNVQMCMHVACILQEVRCAYCHVSFYLHSAPLLLVHLFDSQARRKPTCL